MRPVLVDTSAWVDFLRPGLRPLGERVDELLDADQARICGVVVAELLHGLKGAGEHRQMRWLLDRVQRLDTIEQDWDDAGNLLRELREKGLTVPVTDAILAVVARRNDIAVLTADDHFRLLGAAIDTSGNL